MELARTIQPNVHEAIYSPRALRYMGIPFAFVPVLVFAIYFGAIPTKASSGELTLGIALLFGGIFGIIGLGLLTYARGFTIDTDAGDITTWKRFGFFKKRNRRKLDRFDSVRIFTRVVRTQNSSQMYFIVHLTRGSKPDHGEELVALQAFLPARKLAEQIAKLLQFSYSDATGDGEEVRNFDELDMSVRERAANSGEPVEIPSAPRSDRLDLEVDGEDIVLTIAAKGMTMIHYAIIAIVTVPAIVMTLVIFQFLEDVPAIIQPGIAIFAFLPVAIVSAFVLFNARTNWQLTISRQRLIVEKRGFRETSQELPADAIEEITLGSINQLSSGSSMHFIHGKLPIVVITDETQIAIAGNTNEEEARYIHVLLTAILSAPE